MDYVLSWDEHATIIGIELTYSAPKKDSTVFIFGDPDFGGKQDIFNVIKNIRITSPDVLEIDEGNRRITIYHKGAKKHRIHYEIDGSYSIVKPTVASPTELFRPVIAKGLNLQAPMPNFHKKCTS